MFGSFTGRQVVRDTTTTFQPKGPYDQPASAVVTYENWIQTFCVSLLVSSMIYAFFGGLNSRGANTLYLGIAAAVLSANNVIIILTLLPGQDKKRPLSPATLLSACSLVLIAFSCIAVLLWLGAMIYIIVIVRKPGTVREEFWGELVFVVTSLFCAKGVAALQILQRRAAMREIAHPPQ